MLMSAWPLTTFALVQALGPLVRMYLPEDSSSLSGCEALVRCSASQRQHRHHRCFHDPAPATVAIQLDAKSQISSATQKEEL